MTTRQVTEADFRLPEFRDAKPEDYEFCPDGTIARKDRWITAVNSIRHLVGIDSRSYEICDVVNKVRKLAQIEEDWTDLAALDPEDAEYPGNDMLCDIRINDGSVLFNARFYVAEKHWKWQGLKFDGLVTSWRVPLAVSFKNLPAF